MKTLSMLLVAVLATAASAAVVEDFECWTGAGAVVADPDNARNCVLKLVGGEAVTIPLTEAGVVTIDVYDFGATIQDDEGAGVGNAYGPRWGLAGSAGSAACTIIGKSFINATKGYGYSVADSSMTGSWWSPGWFGGPRQVDALQTIGSGTPLAPEVAGDGAWTTWTFTVSPSGSVYADNGVSSAVLGSIGDVSTIWFSGGKADGTALSTAGVLIDNVTFAVPEPATMSLLALGGLALVRRRRVA